MLAVSRVAVFPSSVTFNPCISPLLPTEIVLFSDLVDSVQLETFGIFTCWVWVVPPESPTSPS